MFKLSLPDHGKMLFGALVWLILDLPLAWMLGPATIGLLFAIREQPIGSDYFFGDLGRGFLGVAIGASITAEHIVWMASHPGLGLGLFAYIAIGGGIGFIWLRHFCGWDQPSAWFAAFPGGMSEMIASAEAFGADIAKVALSHSLRIFCLVAGASVISHLVAGITTESLTFGAVSWSLQPIVLATVVIAVWTGKKLKIPAHSFMAPLFASLAINLIFDLHLRLTDFILIAAQYFIGWGIATRFDGITPSALLKILKEVFVLLLLFIPIWVTTALILGELTEIDIASLILGLAPGGQTEIALIAIALNANLAVVMVLHVIRSLTIISLGPIAYSLITKSKRNKN